MITPQEEAILDVFRSVESPGLRFQHLAPAHLGAEEGAAAIRSLVERGILTPLSGGEYWLTDEGVGLVLTGSPGACDHCV